MFSIQSALLAVVLGSRILSDTVKKLIINYRIGFLTKKSLLDPVILNPYKNGSTILVLSFEVTVQVSTWVKQR